MDKPNLILLDGFAGVGKTTLAQRYVAQYPLAMALDEDKIIVMLGQWLKYEASARELVFAISKAMIATHLASGHDVVAPCLPTSAEHARSFENIASEAGAQFCEVVLAVKREEAIQRLLKRGTWGEEGTDPITEADLPVIEKLYANMEKVLAQRPNAIQIPCQEGNIEGTYQQFLLAINKV